MIVKGGDDGLECSCRQGASPGPGAPHDPAAPGDRVLRVRRSGGQLPGALHPLLLHPRRFEVIPRRASSVEDLLGGGFSTLTSKRGQGTVQGNAVWEQGRWRVVFKRSMETRDPDNDAAFGPGRMQTVAFAVWNGENKERNGQKAIAPWLQLIIDPIASERVEE